MTQSNLPPSDNLSPNEAAQKSTKKSFLRSIKKGLAYSFLAMLLVGFALLGLTATEVGSRATIQFLATLSGAKVMGISGTISKQLVIENVVWQNKKLALTASKVDLTWQPSALIKGQIQVASLSINDILIDITAQESNNATTRPTLPTSLQLPQPLQQIHIQKINLASLIVAQNDANKKTTTTQQYSQIQGAAWATKQQITLDLSGTTPWGDANANATMSATLPYPLNATLHWRGLPIKQQAMTLPTTVIDATFSGQLDDIVLQATLKTESLKAGLTSLDADKSLPVKNDQANSKKVVNAAPLKGTKIDAKVDTNTSANNPASGTIAARLTPFAHFPLSDLALDIKDFNPTTFVSDAPLAQLTIAAQLSLAPTLANAAKATTTNLQGTIFINNQRVNGWHKGGVPLSQLATELTINEEQVTWRNARIILAGGAILSGDGRIQWRDGLTDKAVVKADTKINAKLALLPHVASHIKVEKLDLQQLDARLNKTQLQGQITVDTLSSGWQFLLDLTQNGQQKNTDAKLHTQFAISPERLVTLNALLLQAGDAQLSAQGEWSLITATNNEQAFALTGQMRNFNPARWFAVPEGQISSQFALKGRLPKETQQGWQAQAQVTQLAGQFAGMPVDGAIDLAAHQHDLLTINKLDLTWGAAKITAQGKWFVGDNVATSTNRLLASHAEELQFALRIPNIAKVVNPFKQLLPAQLQQEMTGSIQADAVLSGTVGQPNGQLHIEANNVLLPHYVAISDLQTTLVLAKGNDGKFEGQIQAKNIAIGQLAGAAIDVNDANAAITNIDDLHVTLNGTRHLHHLQLRANLAEQQQFLLNAEGDLQSSNAATGNVMQWQGQIAQFNLVGGIDFALQQPVALTLSSNAAHISDANWQGKLGQLHLMPTTWSQGRIKTAGRFTGLPIVDVIRLWRSDLPIAGKLILDADWSVELGQNVAGNVNIVRRSGDLILADFNSGLGAPLALGLQQAQLNLNLGDKLAQNKFAQNKFAPIQIMLQVQGTQLGKIDGQMQTQLQQVDGAWTLEPNAPITGAVTLDTQDIQFLNHFVTQSLASNVSLHGQLKARASISGNRTVPLYGVHIDGQNLEVALTDLGILLPNGSLSADFKEGQLTLSQLRFTETIKAPPKHEQLASFNGINQQGTLTANGVINVITGEGKITSQWQRFPLMQNNDAWLVVSGQTQLQQWAKSWVLDGQLAADGAYFSMPKQAPPKLSSDVVILSAKDKKSSAKSDNKKEPKTSINLDFTFKTGRQFIFVGRGLNTRLQGEIRLRSKNGGAMQASGSIQTVGGTYEGYGQQLSIVRGIINFQGAPDNPGLNVSAMRRGLAVEAGVEVVGTVAKPEVHLVSEPNVPDADKLSWMVLGRGSDQMAGSEATLLMTAASAIFGSDNGVTNMPQELAHGLGFDDFSVGAASVGPNSQLPSQTVAGTINNATTSGQVVSVGKHIAPNLVLSIERSLSDASNNLKLTWQLSRRLSLVGRAGSDNAIDGQYMFSFNKDGENTKRKRNNKQDQQEQQDPN